MRCVLNVGTITLGPPLRVTLRTHYALGCFITNRFLPSSQKVGSSSSAAPRERRNGKVKKPAKPGVRLTYLGLCTNERKMKSNP
ncbi:hypothetical protein EVAR_47980_1 [Eumeta japonica]|uniref:Uncharacterized protein n=1 Tax=Eumeta variegata TaxID=151549 RepID=A0A4C1XKX4_EUMVA|nr:hypothetical protein EVAR_47980_1 [Eumeta japonica]